MRIQLGTGGKASWRLGSLPSETTDPRYTIAPILPKEWGPSQSLDAQIAESLEDINPAVAEQIRTLLEQDQLFEAKDRLLEYLVTEDHHLHQIEAAAKAKQMVTQLDEQRFCSWMFRIELSAIGIFLIWLVYWVFLDPNLSRLVAERP